MPPSSDTAVAIGVDIGGTTSKTALVGRGPSVLERKQLPMDPGEEPAAVVRKLAAVLRRLQTAAGSDALPVGIGCAGLVDMESGVVRTSPNLPAWKNVPRATMLAQELGVVVVLDNDANVFSIAEGLYGAAKDSQDAVFLTLGTGVGGGLKLGGRMYTGSCGFAGEIGHLTIDVDGPVCSCGNRGCLESFVGSARIVNRARMLIEEQGRQREWLTSRVGSLDELSARDVGQAASENDEIAVRVFEEVGNYIGVAVAGVVNLLNPDMVVIGGGVSNAGEPLLRAVRATVTRRAMGPSSQCVKIEPAQLGEDAGVIGAAMRAAGFHEG
ncbi:MAG: ROK family protein [Candidatus Eiseniibacteriota bacterium]|nr:MAG: ROK family protein [Candidatus Eisenbacteria bacterium]